MSRTAKIIGVAKDCFGDTWDLRQRAFAADSTEAVQGWPQGLPRGRGGSGGPSWILTSLLQQKYVSMRPCETVPHFRDGGYPFGLWVVKKHRRILGIDREGQAEKWWLDRFDDLESMKIGSFCKKYEVSNQSVLNWRTRFGVDRKIGEDYWWESDDAVAIFASDTLAVSWMADHYQISVARVLNIRTALRKKGVKITDRRL